MNTLKQELEITNMNSEWLYKNFHVQKRKKNKSINHHSLFKSPHWRHSRQFGPNWLKMPNYSLYYCSSVLPTFDIQCVQNLYSTDQKQGRARRLILVLFKQLYQYKAMIRLKKIFLKSITDQLWKLFKKNNNSHS